MPSFHVVNLGCKVNKVESDAFATQLLAAGYEQDGLATASVVVVNTCAVTGEAEKKTRKAVRQVCASNSQAQIFVTGCSATLNPEVYRQMSSRVQVLDRLQLSEKLAAFSKESDASDASALALGEGFRSRVGIKVQDGCDNACTYCIVHVARGKAVSRNDREIIREARAYACAGAEEIVLTGINLGSYNYEDGTRTVRLAALLRELLHETDATSLRFDQQAKVSGHPMRFRVSSIEPMDLSDEVIDVIASAQGRICRHLHLPLQAGSTKVLREMNRPYTAEQYLELVERLRAAIPQLSLSTDIIVGFPGETEEEFLQTMQLARQCAFSKIHVFPYSLRQGTPAALRADQVKAEEKSRRAALLRALSDELSEADIARRAGSQELAFVESDGKWMTESYHAVSPQGVCTPGHLTLYTF